MSKIKSVVNRNNEGMLLDAAQIRRIRKSERKARLSGTMPNFRHHLPYSAESINRLFFFLPPITVADLKTPFVGHYSAEENVPNPALDGEPIPVSAPETAPKKATRKPAAKKAAAAKKPAAKTAAKKPAKKTVAATV